MGQKSSKSKSRWSIDDLAFGTGPFAVELEEVFQGAKIIPIQFFGGRKIENDPSMRQLQTDLLVFDETLKRIIRRDKNSSKQDEFIDEPRICQTIIEEDETDLSSPLNKGRWRCRYCTAENNSTDIDCRDCKQNEKRF